MCSVAYESSVQNFRWETRGFVEKLNDIIIVLLRTVKAILPPHT